MFKANLRCVLFVQALFTLPFVTSEPCGGDLKGNYGEIKSPNYPNSYPTNLTCKWIIAPETTHVNLSIDDFDLEDTSDCENYDYVKITLKKRWGEENIIRCGKMKPLQSTLNVKGFPVEIIFHSDNSLTSKGFKLRYKAYDIDPCAVNKGGCSHFCELVKGKRQCSCPSEYGLSYDKQICRYNTSCYFVGYRVCTSGSRSSCVDLKGGKTKCQCWSGYRKVNGVCVDIDECKEQRDACAPGVCSNRIGYFHCSCPSGYSSYGRKCEDINECSQRHPPNCGNGTCVNTPGSHECRCDPGYTFNKNGYHCEDVNECAENNGGCSHQCFNSPGNFSCGCRPGFYMENDGKSCREPKVGKISEVKKATVCQGQITKLSCDEKALIIYTATYGRAASGRVVCPYKESIATNDTDDSSDQALQCGENNVTDEVNEMCGWKKTCDAIANSSVLGLICPNTYKYLKITYGCGIPVRCPSYRTGKTCLNPVRDECSSDSDCSGFKMCCHDGCARACLQPTTYYRDA